MGEITQTSSGRSKLPPSSTRLKKVCWRIVPYLYLAVDLVLTQISFLVAVYFQYAWLSSDTSLISGVYSLSSRWIVAVGILILLIWAFSLSLFSVYSSGRRAGSLWPEIRGLGESLLFSFGMLAIAIFLLEFNEFSKLLFVSFFVANSVVLVCAHIGLRALRAVLNRVLPARRVLIVGTGSLAESIAATMMKTDSRSKAKVIGFLSDTTNLSGLAERLGAPILGNVESAPAAVVEHDIQDVVIALPHHSKAQIAELMQALQGLPPQIRLVPDSFDQIVAAGRREELGTQQFLSVGRKADDPLERMSKRVPDAVLAITTALVAISPLVILIAGLLYLTTAQTGLPAQVDLPDYRYGLMFAIICVVNAVFTHLVLTSLSQFLFNRGVYGIDINKPTRDKIPEEGGVSLCIAFVSTFALFALIWELSWAIPIIATTVLICVVGFVDRFRNLKPFTKLIYGFAVGMLYCALIIKDPLYPFVLTVAYILLIALIYTVSTNVFNLLAGFNGIESGVTVISSGALAVYYYLHGYPQVAGVLVLLAVTYGVMWYFNKYPARIFLGDSGTLMPASVYIGLSVLTGHWVPLFFVLGPHFLNAVLKYLSTGVSSRSDFEPLRYKDGRLHLPEKNYWSVIRLYIKVAGPQEEKQITRFVHLLEMGFCLAMFLFV